MLVHCVSVLIATTSIILLRVYSTTYVTEQTSTCPLWHSVDRASGQCKCCNTQAYMGIFRCSPNEVEILHGWCMTWNNDTQNVEVGRCLLIYQDYQDPYYKNKHLIYTYAIPINTSGSELNDFVCSDVNRKGAQCRQCIDGYGPAVFSDSVTCADCSKHKHHWILYFIFQLSMATIMYLAVVLFEINGTVSPLNIIITYSQLSTIAVMTGSGFHASLVHNLSRKSVIGCLTLFGVWNLDFFRLILPPVCINTSIKAINILLFDYIIAFYPLVLTIFILVGIELNDRNFQIVTCLSIRLKVVCCRPNWNPKETILKTCATFLLSYSKFLFVSINLILAVPIYNCRHESSTVLLYDPTIRFLHLEHIPYVILAVFVIVVIVVVVLLPPVLLLLYPTRCFRTCLRSMGFIIKGGILCT